MWTQCVRNEAQLWADFHHYWLSDGNIDHFNAKASDSRAPTYSEDEDNSDSSSSSSSSGDSSRNIHTQSHTVSARVPTLVVRYEDLLSDPAATMHTISSYLDSGRPPSPQCYLKKPSAQGVLKLPIMSKSNSTSTPTSTSSSNGSSNGTNSDIINPGYRPKGGGIGKSLRRMDARLIKDVLNTPRMKQYLKLFGYDISEPDSKSSVSIVTDSSSSILNKMSEESRTHTYQINIKPSEVCLIDTPTENKSLSESILINDAFSIRSPDDPFGRNFTFTRREITDNDTSPLPTVSRLP